MNQFGMKIYESRVLFVFQKFLAGIFCVGLWGKLIFSGEKFLTFYADFWLLLCVFRVDAETKAQTQADQEVRSPEGRRPGEVGEKGCQAEAETEKQANGWTTRGRS